MNSSPMALGTTVEHFDYHPGDAVYVVRLKAIPRPVLRKPTPTEEDPNAYTDTEQAPLFTYQPEPIQVTEALKEACWRRFGECHTHCVGLNRANP